MRSLLSIFAVLSFWSAIGSTSSGEEITVWHRTVPDTSSLGQYWDLWLGPGDQMSTAVGGQGPDPDEFTPFEIRDSVGTFRRSGDRIYFTDDDDPAQEGWMWGLASVDCQIEEAATTLVLRDCTSEDGVATPEMQFVLDAETTARVNTPK